MLPAVLERECLASGERIARRHRFFHWSLEFPEMCFDAQGRALSEAGFDAVLGNPPWDLLHAEGEDRHAARRLTQQFLAFVRGSGTYRAQSDGHANVYQLFAERALGLLKPGGRIGMVFPAGLLMDRGCAALRRMLFERCRLDPVAGFVNRAAIFPIHRSVRFALITATRGAPSSHIRCRFGLSDAAWLDSLPNHPRDDPAHAFPVEISLLLLKRTRGGDLGIPECHSELDVSIAARLASSFPALGADDGWGASFGRELNASEDRRFLTERSNAASRTAPPELERLPVVEGKHIHPFLVDLDSVRYEVRAKDAARLLPSRPFDRSRLAYRDVASPTNRLTLIAAIVPALAVTTHTLFCLRGKWNADDQAFLCGVLNSYVANYLARMRVSTHVTVAIVEALPVPRPDRASNAYRAIAILAKRLIDSRGDARDARLALQVAVAQLYQFTDGEFAHVLTTFPLISGEEREETLRHFVGGHRAQRMFHHGGHGGHRGY